MNILKLSVVLLAATILVNCERAGRDHATRIFKFDGPTKSVSQKNNKIIAQSSELHTSAINWNTSLTPSTVADINCYAVFVGGPETFMNANSCKDTSTGAIKMRFGPNAGFFPVGSEVALDVPSGPDRVIYLVGLKAQNGACTSFKDTNPDSSNLSYPYILGTQVANLTPGTNEVLISRTLNTSEKFDDCTFVKPGGSGGLAYNFGDTRDGSLNLTGSLTFNGVDGYYMTPAGWTQSTAANAITTNTKKISAHQRMKPLSQSNHTQFQTTTAITTDQFNVGDEIMWHVTAGNAISSPDTLACGGGVYRGYWGTARITAASSSQIDLDRPIGDPTINFAPITQFAETTYNNPSTNPFCFLQFTRIPSFDTITVNSAATLFAVAFDFGTNSPGGVLAFRAKRIVLNSNLIINANGAGFGSSTAGTGHSTAGTGNINASNESGGVGAAGPNGGGGGNVGAGGNGFSGSPYFGGSAITYCYNSSTATNVPCATLRDKKIIFGGGGGGANTVTGSFGGGAIFIQVGEISGAGNLTITANGLAESGTGGGGGAGGSISLAAKNLSLTGTLAISAMGGSTTSGGGSGGGGSAETHICSSISNPARGLSYITSQSAVASGTVSGGSPGGLGGNGHVLAVDKPELCTMP